MFHKNRSTLSLATLALLVLTLAACGGDDSSSDTQSAATNDAAGETVAVQSIDGVGDVLVDAQGAALYTNDRDSGSKIACTGECTSIWVPVQAPSGGDPISDDSAVEAKLGVVERADGESQATFDGKPLYTFVEDGSGEVSGDGLTDSFDGTTFTWTVASTGGTSASPGGGADTETSDTDSGVGGYGY